jgi:peptidoglycan/xylan/chitin deacetylase (PgdA/CDA1 family)
MPRSPNSGPAPLTVRVDPRRFPAERARHVLGTVLDSLGFCWSFGVDEKADVPSLRLYYGPPESCGDADVVVPETVGELDDAELQALDGSPPSGRDGRVRWHHDLVRVAFHLLARQEELDEPARDPLRRFDAGQSRLHRLALADRPALDEALARFGAAIESVAAVHGVPQPRVRRWPHRKSWAAALSHDIDDLGYRDPWFGARCAASFLRNGDPYALRKGGGTLLQWARNRLTGTRYSRWYLDEWLRLEDSAGFRSTFFFVAAGADKHRRDPSYDVTEERLAATLRRMSADGWEVGVHGSFDSYDSAARIRDEKRRLEQVLERPVLGIRQHYLRFAFPLTWRHHEEAGYAYDGTLGFRERLGYRAGTTAPFRPYDPEVGRPLELLALPLTMMDGVLFQEHGPQRDAVDAAIHRCCDTVAALEGLAVFLWHQYTFDRRDRPGWWEAYRTIVERLRSDPAVWVATMADVAHWWRARGDLAVERYQRDGSGSLRLVLRAERGLPGSAALALAQAPAGGGWRLRDQGGAGGELALPRLEPGDTVAVELVPLD